MLNRSLPAAVVVFSAGSFALAALPHGVAAGDITPTTTVLWAISDAQGDLSLEVATDPGFAVLVENPVFLNWPAGQPAVADLTGLVPGTVYYYRFTDATDDLNSSATGTFRTPGLVGMLDGFSMGVSGDWRGELAPFPAVGNADDADLDLFVALGDTIYADFPSPALPIPQAMTLADYRTKHAEVYSERFGLNTLADLRASTSVLVMIDDHEVMNDFAGAADASTDARFPESTGLISETVLFNNGLTAFRDYNPTRRPDYAGTGEPRFDGKPKLYRTARYADDAAVFVLDARTFRDEGLPEITDPNDPFQILGFLAASLTPGRTMLGQTQLDDLKADLLAAHASGALWKFVMVPEPIQNLGPIAASDRFEGYAAERTDLLKFIDDNGIDNVVFVAADIHGTIVNNLDYQNNIVDAPVPTSAIEVTTGSVAFDAPFGPTVVGAAADAGLVTPKQLATYQSLDSAGKDAFLKMLIDDQITQLNYTPIGLEDALVDATLEFGSYINVHTYGWTLFEIDPVTGELAVTTYGIEPYTEEEIDGTAGMAVQAEVLGRTPTALSRFTVRASGFCPADFTGDGNVNADDLAVLLAAWGSAGADLTGDGTTNASDLAVLLAAWGQCG